MRCCSIYLTKIDYKTRDSATVHVILQKTRLCCSTYLTKIYYKTQDSAAVHI